MWPYLVNVVSFDLLKLLEKRLQSPSDSNYSQHTLLSATFESSVKLSLRENRSLSATGVDKCLQAWAKNVQSTSKYMSAPMGIPKIVYSCGRCNNINISLKSSPENFRKIAN